MADIKQFDPMELISLARSGVAKVDQLGPRGITLVTHQETEAMAVLLVLSGALNHPDFDGPLEVRFPQIEKDRAERG